MTETDYRRRIVLRPANKTLKTLGHFRSPRKPQSRGFLTILAPVRCFMRVLLYRHEREALERKTGIRLATPAECGRKAGTNIWRSDEDGMRLRTKALPFSPPSPLPAVPPSLSRLAREIILDAVYSGLLNGDARDSPHRIALSQHRSLAGAANDREARKFLADNDILDPYDDYVRPVPTLATPLLSVSSGLLARPLPLGGRRGKSYRISGASLVAGTTT